MTRFLRSFYARISSVFLLSVVALGAVSIFIAFNSAGLLFDEVEQLLNRGYAASIAEELQPLVGEEFTEEGVKGAIHYMMVLNPMVEIYLVDDSGRIMAYFAGPNDTIERTTIDLSPLESFIQNESQSLILGDDPRTLSERKPFSAAQLQMGGLSGYVYVILRGQSYDRSLQMLRNSYYLQTGLVTFILAIIITVSLGLSLFFLITRRLRRLSSAVRAFEQGQMTSRIDVRGTDELGMLSRTFNEMADSIEAGVENLRNAEEQRKELIANISHDLRSPLTSIRGHLETILLKDDQLTSEKRREFLQTIMKNVSSFQELVEKLFELVRLETRQIQPSYEPFQLAELAQDTVLKLKAQADHAQIRLTIKHPQDLPLIEADIGLIERVLTNLIENAIRFTPPGGSIEIALVGQVDAISIAVADTGSGISEDDLPHVFERFYRADKSRDRAITGTGLGLAIAKEIVEIHRGTIEVQSTVGKGAVFTFHLPLHAR